MQYSYPIGWDAGPNEVKRIRNEAHEAPTKQTRDYIANYTTTGPTLQSAKQMLHSTEKGYRVPNRCHRVPNLGYRVPNRGYRVPHRSYRVPNTGYRVPNTGYRVLPSTKQRLRSSEQRLPSTEQRLPNTEQKTHYQTQHQRDLAKKKAYCTALLILVTVPAQAITAISLPGYRY